MIIKARSRALATEHRNRAWLAWHIAALPMMKKFPKLDDLAGKPAASAAPTRQSAAEIETTMRRWQAVMSQVSTQGKGGRHG